MPYMMQDLNMLVSAFTAKPWRQGCSPLLAFVFRTRAAAAYTGSTGAASATQPNSRTANPTTAGKAIDSAKRAAVL